MRRVIALANQKGGVGKTTSTINIGYALSMLGKKVMLIDLDPQAHLTYSLGIQAHELESTIYDVLKGNSDVESACREINGVTILPSSLDLSGADIELASIPGREQLLNEALKPYFKNFDYILIDCPPSLGLLTLNCFTTVKEIFVPIQTEFLALQGLGKLIETVDIIKKRLNPALNITSIIGSRYDSRKNLSREVVQKIEEHFGKKLLRPLIRENVALAEAPSYGQDIFSYKESSYGAEDYLALSKVIIKQEKRK